MKSTFRSLFLASLTLVGFSLPSLAAPCVTGVTLKPLQLEITSAAGQATLIGFNAFSGASTPPKKYRRKQTSGTMTVGFWGGAGCPQPVYPTSYEEGAEKVSIAGNPFWITWSASLTPQGGSGGADAPVTFRATTSGLSINPNGGTPTTFPVFIRVAGAIEGSVDDVVLGHGETIVLDPRSGSAPYTVYAFSNSLYGGSLPVSPVQLVAPAFPQVRDEWNAASEYDGGDATGQAWAEVSDRSVRYQGSSAIFPFSGGAASGPPTEGNYAGLVNETLGSTLRRVTGTGECVPVAAGSRRAVGTVSEQLSVEDTEKEAEARAVLARGTSNVAFRTRRTTGFSFQFARVHYAARFEVQCPGDYAVHVRYAARPRGASGERLFRVVGAVRRLEHGVQTVEGDIIVAEDDPDFNEFDVEYSLEGIEMQSVCPDAEPGGLSAALGSVHLQIGLGRAAGDLSAGQLSLQAEEIRPEVYTPARLVAAVPKSAAADVVRDSTGSLRQVRSSQALADIVTQSPLAYAIRFYSAEQLGPRDPVTRLYPVSGAPFVTYTIENPTPDEFLVNRLRITEVRGSSRRVTEYVFDYEDGNPRWTFSRADGARRETEVTLPPPVTGGGPVVVGDPVVVGGTGLRSDRLKVTTVTDSNGVLASKVARYYRDFPWGEELVREVRDPEGAALTTDFVFYETVAETDPNYRRLQQRTNADGSWQRFSYATGGHIAKTVRPFLNAAPDTTDEALCRVTTEVAEAMPDADGDGISETRSTTVEQTLGRETARRYRIDWSRAVALGGEPFRRRTEIVCVVPGAAWNDGANLTTETLLVSSGSLAGRTRRVVHPDGTVNLTRFVLAADGQLTTTEERGQPNPTRDGIVAGTRTVRLTSARGQLVSETVSDVASGLALGRWAASQFDAMGRPTRLDYDDGTFVTRSYACCGVEAERDRTGLSVNYDYDALGRQILVMRQGIGSQTDYDAEGRPVTVTRIGTDGSRIVQQASRFDLAGRLVEQRDALGRPTRYSETFDAASGQTTRTTVYPDGGTRVESFARDGSLVQIGGTAAAPREFEYGVESTGAYVKEIAVGQDSAGQMTRTEWIKRRTDHAGREFLIEYADGAIARIEFDGAGRKVREVDPDGVVLLHRYNALGEREVSAVDLNRNGAIDFAGPDRITRTSEVATTRIESGATYVVQRSSTEVWEFEGQDTPVTIATTERAVDGRRAWETVRGLTTTTLTTFDGAGASTIVRTSPDGVQTRQVFNGNRLVSTVTRTSDGTQLRATALNYDAHGRLAASTEAREGTTTYRYYADDRAESVTSPDPDETRSGVGYDPQTTRYTYDGAGRLAAVTAPDGGVSTTTYWPTGQVRRLAGARTNPVEYAYDVQGRVKTLTTWKKAADPTTAAVTTWHYDARRGFPVGQRYADSAGVSYGYYPSGRLQSRTWARTPAINTTYSYSAAGELELTHYSDATPDVRVTYDRLGRPKTISDAAGSRVLDYHSSGRLEDETYLTGVLEGVKIDRNLDALLRVNGLTVPAVLAVTYGYDGASRLARVTSGPQTVNYGYLANDSTVEAITFRSGETVRLTTSKVYDRLGRLTSIGSVPTGAGIGLSYAYAFDAANQRTRVTRADGSYWNFQYDALGQVVGGKKFLPSGAPGLGADFAWSFDEMGNRQTATTNGAVASYLTNPLNQYLERTVPGVVDVTGAAAAAATVAVTVNGGAPLAVARQGEAYYRQVSVDNAVRDQTVAIKVLGARNLVGPNGEDAIAEESRRVFLARTPEAFAYDADGNLVDDARWRYTWDAENRLISVETSAAAVAAGLSRVRVEYLYDGQSRRIARKVLTGNGAVWTTSAHTLFVYDRWNLLAELDALTAKTPVRTYVWGLDLAEDSGDAGGIGGLLVATMRPSPSAPLSTYAYSYDGNGNVAGLINLADGTVAASYDYSAFGEILQAEGPAAAANPFRFSTKWHDPETAHAYFGYRYYNSETGRWLSRDPLGESGGVGLYQFVSNAPTTWSDPLGLALYAFDGTNNDGYRDVLKREETNVFALYSLYRGAKAYESGVGTNDGIMNVFGLAFGAGGQERIERMLGTVERFLKEGETVADILGFSRGAAQARAFANRLKERFPCVRIRWMGLFDTVASEGLPNDINLGYKLGIPKDTDAVFHLTAGGERRAKTFALTSIKDGPKTPNPNPNYRESEIPDASHSDVGGGYGSNRGIANFALLSMWQNGRANGVPFDSLPSKYSSFVGTPHDSRWPNDRIVELFTGRHRVRKIYYHP